MSRLTAYVVALLLTWSRLAGAQVPDSDYAERGPRFLLASTAAPVPVRVDVTRTPVLRQSISLDLNRAALSDALREVSAKAGMQLAFSNTMLPAERTVTFRADHITVAAALTELLIDTQVDVLFSSDGRAVLVRRAEAFQGGTVSGRVTDAKSGKAIPNVSVHLEGTRWRATTDENGGYRLTDVPAGTYTLTVMRIGYTKRSQQVSIAAEKGATLDVALQAAPTELEGIVVSGSIVPTERKAIPTPISVITGEEIEQKGYQRIEQIFRGDVPGAVAFMNPGYSDLAQINLRGATDLGGGSSAFKTYIDGVEAAAPGFYAVATLDLNNIDRIEVLRGPQGSTVYGSDAMAGVIQIFTKKGIHTLHPQVEAKASAGLIESRWDNAAEQDHSVAVSGGGPDLSYRVGAGWLRTGDWVPGARMTNVNLSGSTSATQGPVTIGLSARYFSRSFAEPWNSDFQQFSFFATPSDRPKSGRAQTYGLNIKYAATPRWQHTLVLGYDRFLFGTHLNTPDRRTPDDTLLWYSTFDESKVSVAYNTTYQMSLGPAAQATFTGGADHWTYQYGSFYGTGLTRTNNVSIYPAYAYTSQYANSGYFAQAQLGFSEALFVTAGVRAEDNQNFGQDFGLLWAPRAGVSYVRTLGGVTAKARASYGKAIRPPCAGCANAVVSASSEQKANPNLAPEQQVGPDGGLELYFGGRGSLEVTYYHQTAIDLIDYVNLGSPGGVYTYQVQNVGRAQNTGWEFQGRLNAGRLSLTGTYAIASSVIQRLRAGYTGDLRVGEQILGIPKHTAGATLSYSLPRTTVTLGMTYIGSWTNTDYIALYGYFLGGQPFRGAYRDYWIAYPRIRKFNLAVSQILTSRLSIFLLSDNLSNNNASEYHNFNPQTGRVTRLGVRATS